MTLIQTKQSILKLIKEAEAQFSGTGKSFLDIEDYVAEYLTANGVIVPPVKVGDAVYRVCKKKYDVDGYGMQFVEDWGVVTNTFHLGMLHEIGKTVFLTREEAEQAIAERNGE